MKKEENRPTLFFFLIRKIRYDCIVSTYVCVYMKQNRVDGIIIQGSWIAQ